MSRTELRNAKLGKATAAGSLECELEALRKLQESSDVKEVVTITVTCTEVLTIICC